MKPQAEIIGSARPVRVAFVIEDGDGVDGWLDAAFSEAFGRHGGRQSLLLPVANGSIPPLYIEWLRAIDPDHIYLATTDNEKFCKQLDRLCSPLRMEAIERVPSKGGTRPPRFRVEDVALSSLSWLPFLKVASGGFRGRPEGILDCYPQWQDDGLVTDNFGTLYRAFDRFPLHRELADLVKPMMLTPKDAPKDRWSFRIEATEYMDAYEALKPLSDSSRFISLAYLSNLHSKRLSVREHRWTDSFCLVVGDSFVDRVSCWNAGLLFDDAQQQTYKTFRLPASVLGESEKILRVQEFINQNNWIRSHSGPAKVTIRSSSIDEATLKEFASRIGAKGSWCSYNVKTIASIEECCPTSPPTSNRSMFLASRRETSGDVQIPLRHTSESTPVPKPFHLQHAPTAHPICSAGRWVSEYSVDRTSDNNRFGNVRDWWKLPRGNQLTGLFVQNIQARGTADGSIGVFVERSTDRVSLSEPPDERFFNVLLHEPPSYPYSDARYRERIDVPYQYSRPSDKGRYLQGVLGLFGSIHRAHDVLTHGFWRRQFAKLGNPAEDQYPKIVETLKKRFPPQGGKVTLETSDQWEKLARTVVAQSMNVRQPKLTIKLRTLQKEWAQELEQAIELDAHLNSRKKEILAEAPEELARSLENLCHEGVFHQGYSWPCPNCAYRNWAAIDALRMTLTCQVCHREHRTPVALEFDFRMNEFLATCLREHDTLSVIWALGHLGSRASSFIYSPQMELFRKWPEEQGGNPDREVDILCVIDGKVVIGETKASVSEIDNNEIDNLVALAQELSPDVVFLGAMQGSKARFDAKIRNLKERLGSEIQIHGLREDGANDPESYLP